MHDNTVNAVNSVKLTGRPHFGCVGHTLQLCVNTGLGIYPSPTRRVYEDMLVDVCVSVLALNS